MSVRLSGRKSAYTLEAKRLRKLAQAKRDITANPELEAFLKQSSSSSPFLDWLTRSLTADENLRRHSRRLRARARDLEETTPYVSHALDMIADGVIGPAGPRMAAEFKGASGTLLDDLNDAIEAAWQDWDGNPVTLDGCFDLVTFSRLLVRTVFRDGEVFVRLWRGRKYNPYGLALEAVDPDMVDETYNVPSGEGQNEIRLGVEVDAYGRRVAYHFLPEQGPSGSYRGERERVTASDMIHIFQPRRVNQTRGLTALLPILISLKSEQSYSDSELMAAVLGSSASFAYTEQLSADGLAPPPKEGDDKDKGNFQTQLEPGMGWVVPRGYKVDMLQAQHPTSAYPAFIKAVVRKISIGFGLSYHSTSGDLESTSYSSARVGMLQERDFFKNSQRFWHMQFNNRVCREWLALADLASKIALPTYDPAEYMRAIRWIGRGWSYVDPEKEGQANALDLQNGLTSHSRILAEQGVDYVDVLRERKLDRDRRAKYDEQEPQILVPTPKPKPAANADETPNPPADDTARDYTPNGNGHNRIASVLSGGSR